MTITMLQGFVAACGGFSCVCVAVGWLIKIIKSLKKPSEDVNDKLKRDYDRINKLESDMAEIKQFMGQMNDNFIFLLENDLVAFEHMRTNNSTGKITKQEASINQFLLHNKRKEMDK